MSGAIITLITLLFLSGTTICTSDEKFAPLPWKFVISVQLKTVKGYKHLCGGTIIDKRFVLTAAHCILTPKPLKVRDLRVAAGTKWLHGPNTVRFHVTALRTHKAFKAFKSHDIAVLRVDPMIPIDHIRYDILNFRNMTRKDESSDTILIGWGQVNSTDKPKAIETVHFHTISNDKCRMDYRFKYLTTAEICVLNNKGEMRGACDGDSGSPLLHVETNELYGLLSYGRKPCQAGNPFAFTRISSYSQWIDEMISKMKKR